MVTQTSSDAMDAALPVPERRSTRSAVVDELRGIGAWGRVALIGLVIAGVLTVLMGFTITRTARNHLLDARADLVAAEVERLPALAQVEDPEFADFSAAVIDEFHGGEILEVKVWSPTGEVLASSDPHLTGQVFPVEGPLLAALGGDVRAEVSDVSDPAHAGQQGVDELIEVYVPVENGDGEVVTVIEVEQSLDSLNATLTDINRNVWLSISFGVGVLAIFLMSLGRSLVRTADRRREQAESLLGAAFRAQDEERRRIVGALHDDVGQPLYRLLYGLEGSKAKLSPEDPIAEEIDRMGDLVRSIDATLRAELDHLHEGLAADAGLVTALEDLAETTRAESGLVVHVEVGPEPTGLTDVGRTALFRAAQEGVVNARKHAKAHSLTITVREAGDRVTVSVADDGSGGSIHPGLGLTTTEERLDALGGGLRVSSSHRSGTTLHAWLPVGGTA